MPVLENRWFTCDEAFPAPVFHLCTDARFPADAPYAAQRLDMLVFPENGAADEVRLDIEDHAPFAAFEFDDLAVHYIGKTVETADPVGGKYCAMCGELLERACPNCGAPVHAGAICSLCGQPYVVAAK